MCVLSWKYRHLAVSVQKASPFGCIDQFYVSAMYYVRVHNNLLRVKYLFIEMYGTVASSRLYGVSSGVLGTHTSVNNTRIRWTRKKIHFFRFSCLLSVESIGVGREARHLQLHWSDGIVRMVVVIHSDTHSILGTAKTFPNWMAFDFRDALEAAVQRQHCELLVCIIQNSTKNKYDAEQKKLSVMVAKTIKHKKNVFFWVCVLVFFPEFILLCPSQRKSRRSISIFLSLSLALKRYTTMSLICQFCYVSFW